MECKTEGSCKGAAKIRGNSKQTQNIKAGGKGTLANSGKRRKRSPNIVNMQCNTKGSCKGAVKIRGNSAQTQNIGKGGKGILSNKGKRRRRSPDDEDDKKSSDKKAFIGKQVVKNKKGAKSSVNDCKDGKCKTSKLGKVLTINMKHTNTTLEMFSMTTMISIHLTGKVHSKECIGRQGNDGSYEKCKKRTIWLSQQKMLGIIRCFWAKICCKTFNKAELF